MELVIDEEFGAKLDGAVAAAEAARPRTQQKTLGPSSVGGCREYIRATVAGDPGIPERPRGVDPAFIGTVVGDALENIFEQYLGATTQIQCKVTLPRSGLVIAGNSDAVFVDANIVTDLKGCDSFAEVIYDLKRHGFLNPKRSGKYFKYAVQIAIYVLALVQAGILEQGATARLVFFERSGKAKKFLVIPLEWDALMKAIDLAEDRLGDVVRVLNAGSPEPARWGLRDQEPSLCFYTQCPFRIACWGDSEHVPTGEITGENEIQLIEDFIVAREDEKGVKARRANIKEELRPIAGGITPKIVAPGVPDNDGFILSWRNDTPYVTPK